MIHLFLLLASLCQAQAPAFEDNFRNSNVGKDIRALMRGRPTITGIPRFINGIQWADGSISTSAGSGGGGAGETNTYTSSKTFTDITNGVLVKSSVTASAFFGSFHGDGSNLTGIAASSGTSLVSSRTVVGVTASTFTFTATAGKVYYAVWKATQNTTQGDFGITFNGDTGNNYAYYGRCDNSDGISAVPTGTGGNQIYFDEQTTNRLTAQSVHRGSARIYIDPDGTNQPTVEGVNNIRLGAGTLWIRCANGGHWKSNASVTSIEMRVNGGNFTGTLYFYESEAFPDGGSGGSGGTTDTTKVAKAGDTMTGALTVTGTSVNASGFFGDGSRLAGLRDDITDANSLVVGDIGNPVWSSHFPSNSVSARQNAGYDGAAYSDLTELNHSTSAGTFATRAYLFVAPPGATSVRFTVPMKLPSGYSASTVRINISNTDNVELSGLDCVLTSSLVSYSTTVAVVAGSSYVVQAVFNNIALMSNSQRHALVGRVTLTATGATGVLAGAYKHLQVLPAMFHDNVNGAIGTDLTVTNGQAKLALETNADSLLVEVHNEGPIVSGVDNTAISVYVNGRYYMSSSLTSASPVNQFLPAISLPTGSKRVDLVTSSQYGLNTGMFMRSIFVPSETTLSVIPPPPARRVLVYGDSISAGYYASTATVQGWVNLLRDRSGYAVTNHAYAGRALSSDFTTVNGFYPIVRRWAGANPTDIWIAIGSNDYGIATQSAASFGQMYGQLLNTIQEVLPNARVWAQTPLVRVSESANVFGDTLGNYRTQIDNNVNDVGFRTRLNFVNLIDGAAILTTASLYDDVHPTTSGHAKIADYVYTVLSGSSSTANALAGDTVFISSQNTAGLIIQGIANQAQDYQTILDSSQNIVLSVSSRGFMGVGTAAPDTKLHVAGSVKIVDGTQAVGRVLTSDANGAGSWTAVAGTGDMILASINQVTGSIRISTGGFLAFGDVGVSLNTGSGLYAKSMDGATQSSGCVVVVYFPDGGAATDLPLFTSTTTSPVGYATAKAGVLLESCSPLSTCKVGFGTGQPYRIQADSSGLSAGDPSFTTSATRCRAAAQAVYNDNAHGTKMQSGAVSANAFFWARLR